jgi:hypothetical protein
MEGEEFTAKDAKDAKGLSGISNEGRDHYKPEDYCSQARSNSVSVEVIGIPPLRRLRVGISEKA